MVLHWCTVLMVNTMEIVSEEHAQLNINEISFTLIIVCKYRDYLAHENVNTRTQDYRCSRIQNAYVQYRERRMRERRKFCGFRT